MDDEPTAGLPARRGPLATPDAGRRPADGGPSSVGGASPAGGAPPVAGGPSSVGDAPPSGAIAPPPSFAATPGTRSVPVGRDPGDPAPAGVARRRRRWPVVLLVLALLGALGAAGYLYATTTAYADRVVWTEDEARRIGTELVTTRSELEGVRGELQGVRDQLATAQERITALADEKAQIGDDREAQAQLLDYQARVSEAAGIVASALDRCVQGQDQLIEYLENADSYDPAELARFGDDVERLCASASEANVALQSELADR